MLSSPPFPPGAREIRSTRGRYASYWNAFLFGKIFANSCMKMIQIGPREVEKLLDFTKFVRLIFIFRKTITKNSDGNSD